MPTKKTCTDTRRTAKSGTGKGVLGQKGASWSDLGMRDGQSTAKAQIKLWPYHNHIFDLPGLGLKIRWATTTADDGGRGHFRGSTSSPHGMLPWVDRVEGQKCCETQHLEA